MKDFSTEQRTLLAFLLTLIVLIVWSLFYKPPKPVPKPEQPVATQPAPSKPAIPEKVTPAAAAPAVPAKAAGQEKTIVVENDLYRVEFSNRGAVVRSWQLKKYTDDAKPPHTLDLVHPPANAGTGEWPFALMLQDPELQKEVNSALFLVTPENQSVRAPVELDSEWSNGHLAVSKRLRFAHDYVVELETSVLLDGRPLAHAVAWRGGFGDATARKAAQQVTAYYQSGGKLQVISYKNLGTSGHPEEPLREPNAIEFAGIEDQYFAAAFLPQDTPLDFWHWRIGRQVTEDGKTEQESVAEVAAGSVNPGPLSLRVYVGPKDFTDLGSVRPSLRQLVQFGWFGFIAEPLFYILKYIHNYVPNYGWAIVALTLVINMALLPLKVKSWRSMQKMQKVMPEIKNIQNRYSKYSMRDPRKQEMNKEVMAVYQREGINPMGGCLPMVIQMPIWFALYRMLAVVIELRHAPWIGWIHDLSAYDPYYILPILMTVTMYLMQKMTPATTADPTQQKMMTLMPIFMGVLFFTLSSGLVLYIFTSNLVGIGQQWYLNRTAPAAAAAGQKKK